MPRIIRPDLLMVPEPADLEKKKEEEIKKAIKRIKELKKARKREKRNKR